MRITAEIFDEDLYFGKEEDLCKNKSSEWLAKAQNTALNHSSYFQFNTSSSSHKPRRRRWRARKRKYIQQCQKVHEVTQRLSHLHLSDSLSSFEAFNLTAPDGLQSGYPNQENIKMDKGNIESEASSGSPPVWLQQYLLNMKHEIKREILNELYSVPETEKHITSNIPVSDECESHFQIGEIVHEGIYCDNCDQVIRGIRYKCGNCSDFDLCQECETLPNVHNKNHIFLKVRTPIALKGYQRQKWQELMQPSCSQLYAMGGKNRQAKKLYAAKFIHDETVPDSTIIPPSIKFVKSWRVVNCGTRAWSHSTRLHLIQGSPDLWPNSEHVDVPHLKPGEEGVVSVHFTSPASEGVYRSHWNFCHRSRPFGDIVWCHIVVKKEKETVQVVEPEALPPLPDTLYDSGIKLEINKLNEEDSEKKLSDMSCFAQVLAAVQEQEASTMVPRKLVVTSHTATPTNTPFDLSPPKSPDHHEMAIKEIQELNPENNSKITITLHESDHDDECSIVSLSSTDSEAEFVVVPWPKCFNFDEAFVLRNTPMQPEGETKKDQIEKTSKSIHSIPISNLDVMKMQPVHHKTISQETGVPELPESDTQAAVEVQVTLQNPSTSDGSSEVSIIESGGSSPVSEEILTEVKTINITVSNDAPPNVPVAQQCEQSVQVKLESEELLVEPSSTTFPKFPIAEVARAFDPTPSCNEERTIPMLPESIMTGALSAAASVYNTARDIITNIQQPKEQQGTSPNAMEQLIEMGFCNRILNETLLKRHRGDMPSVVAELVGMNDNDWYASRHNPATPPASFLD